MSIKGDWEDVTGTVMEALYITRQGCSLDQATAADFVPLRLSRVFDLAVKTSIDENRMMSELMAARFETSGQIPPLESLLHAVIPSRVVQFSCPDEIAVLSGLEDGRARLQRAFGEELRVLPYIGSMSELARNVERLWDDSNGANRNAIVLLNRGLCTFGDSSEECLRELAFFLDRATTELGAFSDRDFPPVSPPDVDPVSIASLRMNWSRAAGRPMLLRRSCDRAALWLARHSEIDRLTQIGPLIPDDIWLTRYTPMVGRDVGSYASARVAQRSRRDETVDGNENHLDSAPRILLDWDLGMVAAGCSPSVLNRAYDAYRHTIWTMAQSEFLGRYQALSLDESAELGEDAEKVGEVAGAHGQMPLHGEVALVTGAASGIGRACAAELLDGGAAVIGVDIATDVGQTFNVPGWFGICADLTDTDQMREALRLGVERFGGVDIAVLAAGIFGPSHPIDGFNEEAWRNVLAINLDSTLQALSSLHPLLSSSPRFGRVVLIGSKNVRAPGPGVAAYSASKAAATQVARVAALEWAADGIRVNVVHPDAVFDTGLWTEQALTSRAESYGLSVEDYKRRNLLSIEIKSADVGRLVGWLVDPANGSITGAQIPIDGGNERVV